MCAKVWCNLYKFGGRLANLSGNWWTTMKMIFSKMKWILFTALQNIYSGNVCRSQTHLVQTCKVCAKVWCTLCKVHMRCWKKSTSTQRRSKYNPPFHQKSIFSVTYMSHENISFFLLSLLTLQVLQHCLCISCDISSHLHYFFSSCLQKKKGRFFFFFSTMFVCFNFTSYYSQYFF